MRTPTAFIFGALAATLIAAAAFRGGGQPVDSTFTYQGQLRNAGQLVNGSVDVRFTLWDSDVGGTQIGNTNSFTNYPLTDGRFALGLNFGNGAFNGDQRWVQVEFRSPAGVGQYLTLNPRDKIMATPYALYALNGTASQWDYNPKTQSLTAAANVTKVGIGTSTPTAALEVVSATGGDDAVKLPAGSIGSDETTGGIAMLGLLQGEIPYGNSAQPRTLTYTINLPNSGYLLCDGLFEHNAYGGSSLAIDGIGVLASPVQTGSMDQRILVPLTGGVHVITVTTSAGGSFPNGCRFDLSLHFAASRLILAPQ
jgi:hypothetical protein